jgi:oligosaccharide repeat unit polymerase
MDKRKVERFISVFVVIILSLLFLFFEDGINDMLIVVCLTIFYFYFYQSISKSFSIKGIRTFFKIDFLFLLFYFIIYYYPYQLYVVGIYKIDTDLAWYSNYVEYTNKAVLLATIGLVAFMNGYKTLASFKASNVISFNTKNMKLISNLFLFLIILILVAFYISGGTEMFIGIYAGSDAGDITANAIFSLVTYFIIIGLIQVIFYYHIFKKVIIINYLIILIGLLWSLALLYLGDRNTFFLIAIACAGGVSTYIRNINRLQILFLATFAFFVYNIVEVSRSNEDKSFDAIAESYFEVEEKRNEIIGIDTFNTTTIGLRATFNVVPLQNDFFYGKFKLIGLASIIPYSSRLFVNEDDPFLSSADVIKDEMITANAGWGTGTNLISDCYMDFGILGVIFFMFVLGYYGGKIRNSSIRNPDSAKFFFLYIIVLAYYSEIVRYGFDFPLRALIWTPVIFYFLEKKRK